MRISYHGNRDNYTEVALKAMAMLCKGDLLGGSCSPKTTKEEPDHNFIVFSFRSPYLALSFKDMIASVAFTLPRSVVAIKTPTIPQTEFP